MNRTPSHLWSCRCNYCKDARRRMLVSVLWMVAAVLCVTVVPLTLAMLLGGCGPVAHPDDVLEYRQEHAVIGCVERSLTCPEGQPWAASWHCATGPAVEPRGRKTIPEGSGPVRGVTCEACGAGTLIVSLRCREVP